ncbi:MAG TPA: HdeD family acid-resistance protein [Acidimicrobiales bacterium]|nr:HdeD family acid-resistance protein [Acidimicrobiales bacterium]
MNRTAIVMDEATATEAAEGLERIWWLLLADGILSLVIGFLVLSWRQQTLQVLAYFLGAWLCVIGVLQLVSGIRALKTRWPYALMGLVALGAGIATLAWPHVTLYVLATILGWTLMLWGIFDVIGAFLRREVPHWWLGIIKGVVLLALGIWAIRHPGNALTVLITVFGVTCVFWGAVELVAAFFARHAKRNLDRATARPG